MGPHKRLLRATLAISAVLHGAPLWAQSASAQDIAAAEALFEEGKRLMSDGEHAAACPKLLESQRLDPGGGTLIALALCYEGAGKTASAWASFNEALTVALRDNNTARVAVARKHLAELEPRLARIVLRVPAEVLSLPGLEITQDGVSLRRAAWDTPLPVDPGAHEIVVFAKGKKRWQQRVADVAPGSIQEITVPNLEDERPELPRAEPALKVPQQSSAPTQSQSQSHRSSTKSGGFGRVAALVSGGLGLVALGGGTYFGLSAMSERKEAKRRCPGTTCSDRQGLELNESAGNKADLSTIAFGLGAAFVGASVVLYLYSPTNETDGPQTTRKTQPQALSASVSAHAASVTFSGQF